MCLLRADEVAADEVAADEVAADEVAADEVAAAVEPSSRLLALPNELFTACLPAAAVTSLLALELSCMELSLHLRSSSGSASVVSSSVAGHACFLARMEKHHSRRSFLRVAAGGSSSISMNSREGCVMVWGRNDWGQLGLGEEIDCVSPLPARMIPGIVEGSLGSTHSCFVTEESGLLCSGNVEHGRLGIGDVNDESLIDDGAHEPLPPLCPLLTSLQAPIMKISCGDAFCFALTRSGVCFTWGSGCEGQLGHGIFQDESKPRQMMSSARFIDMSCGGQFTLLLTVKREVLSCGQNRDFQCGQRQIEASGVTKAGTGSCVATSKPVLMPCPDAVTVIAAGFEHSMVVTQNGQLVAFGNGRHGRLGLDDELEKNTLPCFVDGLESPCVAACAGWHHTCAVDASARVFAFGSNVFGQCSASRRTTRVLLPTQVNLISDLLPLVVVSVISIASGSHHSLASIKLAPHAGDAKDGGAVAIVAWGSNAFHQTSRSHGDMYEPCLLRLIYDN